MGYNREIYERLSREEFLRRGRVLICNILDESRPRLQSTPYYRSLTGVQYTHGAFYFANSHSKQAENTVSDSSPYQRGVLRAGVRQDERVDS